MAGVKKNCFDDNSCDEQLCAKLIDDLKWRIDVANEVNFKNEKIRNFKIFGVNFRNSAVKVLAGGVIIGTLSLPFFIDGKEEIPAKSKKIFDSYGNKIVEMINSENVEDESNYLKVYSKWKENNDGTFSRKVEVYSFNNKSEDDKHNYREINKYVKNNDLSGSDKKHFDEEHLLEVKKEHVMNLSSLEFNNKYGNIVAEMISDCKDKTLIVDKDKENFFIIALISVIAEVLAVMWVFADDVRKKKLKIDKICENYPIIDVNKLVRELERQEEKYKILVRK